MQYDDGCTKSSNGEGVAFIVAFMCNTGNTEYEAQSSRHAAN